MPCASSARISWHRNQRGVLLRVYSGHRRRPTLACDIFAMLCALDENLGGDSCDLPAREGRELEIPDPGPIMGTTTLGRAKRVRIRSWLKRAGYRISRRFAIPETWCCRPPGSRRGLKSTMRRARRNVAARVSRMAGDGCVDGAVAGPGQPFFGSSTPGRAGGN